MTICVKGKLKYSRGANFRLFPIYKQEVHERKEKNETFEFKTPLVHKEKNDKLCQR
jgi:hypothetical protein